jgi:hypothetical protein
VVLLLEAARGAVLLEAAAAELVLELAPELVPELVVLVPAPVLARAPLVVEEVELTPVPPPMGTVAPPGLPDVSQPTMVPVMTVKVAIRAFMLSRVRTISACPFKCADRKDAETVANRQHLRGVKEGSLPFAQAYRQRAGGASTPCVVAGVCCGGDWLECGK